MKKRLISYHDELMKALKDPNEALEYLNAALRDDDPRVFLLAVKNVVEAQGGEMATLAKKAKLNRENLYRMLSEKGNPKLTSIISLLNVLGMDLAVQPYERSKK